MNKQILLFTLVMVPLLTFGFSGEVVINDIKYSLDTDKQTAEVRPNNYSGNIVLPSSVIYDGIECYVTSIGYNAFGGCDLKSISIPQTVNTINGGAFRECIGLTSVHITDIASWCRITIANDYGANPLTYAHHLYLNGKEVKDLVIPDEVTSIPLLSFYGCWSLTSLSIPASVTSVGGEAFGDCPNITSIKVVRNNVKYDSRGDCNAIIDSETNTLILGCQNTTIPDDIVSIGHCAFSGCSTLTSLSIPAKVNSIKDWAFYGCSGLVYLSLYSETIPEIKSNTFADSNYKNATLYVPTAFIDDYRETAVWKDFKYIYPIEGANGEKCAKPTISYNNGKISFNSTTEGAYFLSSISDSDIGSYTGNEIPLQITYNITVYAKAYGYLNSDVVTATLCWIDAEPQSEGITNVEVAKFKSNPILIQREGNELTISGVLSGLPIHVYDMSGKLIGMSMSDNTGSVRFNITNSDKILVVKFGNKSVKVSR